MAKYLKKEEKKPLWPKVILLVILAAVLIALVVFVLSGREEPSPEKDVSTEPAPAETAAVTEGADVPEPTEMAAVSVEYPLALEGGSLQIASLFQYDGINPDCGNQEGEDIASIMLTNTSGAYLSEALITLELSDGTSAVFAVTDLPAGKTAMVFSRDNVSIASDTVCVSAACEAVWDDASPMPDQIAVSAEGMLVTLTNNSGEDISELVVYCRSPFGEEYFGGITYQYTVNDFSANGTATVEAWDCVMGIAEVVRIVIN
ncbi:MAG: hypothetical protein IJ375_05285 [Oscillospiraceae bacterium]|nr:hypothetical protein [Oscillospiraceae bacterium]